MTLHDDVRITAKGTPRWLLEREGLLPPSNPAAALKRAQKRKREYWRRFSIIMGAGTVFYAALAFMG